MGNRLAEVRGERGWKKARLLFELRAAAARRRETLPKDESLGRRVAAWENQGAPVSDFYRDLLCEVYERTAAELGLVDTALSIVPAQSLPEPPKRSLSLIRLDSGIVELVRNQTQSLRMLDRRLGGPAVFQQTASHVTHIEELCRNALPGPGREDLADELGQAAALAGWQALDSGRLDDAWRHHEVAASASRESGVAAGLAYATAQQGYVLVDAGRPTDAHELVVAARRRAARFVPGELVAWLFAAEGEVLSVLGERDAALRAMDEADAHLSREPENALPYLMLDAGHLARWRGHCLARLGEESAVDDLTAALRSIGEGRFGRAEAGLRVDLALALHARGEADASRQQARLADELAGRTGSQRQRRRIAELLSA